MIELLYLFMPITFDHSYFVLLVRCYLLKYDSSTCLNYDRAALLVYAYTFDHSYFVLLVRCYLLKYDSSTCLNYDQTVLLVFYAYHVLCLSRLIIVILFYSYDATC